MPINPRSYENISVALTEAAERATTAMLELQKRLGTILIVEPNDILKASGILEREIRTIIQQYNRDIQVWINTDLPDAYLTGIKHTDTDIRAINPRLRPDGVPTEQQPLAPQPLTTPEQKRLIGFGEHANHRKLVNTFQAAALDQLKRTFAPIIRDTRDKFRQLTIQATDEFFRTADTFTRRNLSQSILNTFADQGIQGIRYRDGRYVPLESYLETVGRTMTGRSAMQGALNRYEEYGYDLVRVSQHAMSCPICEPWEGEILSQSGENENYPSLDEAVNDGLFHPNCAHDVSPYFPGQSEPLEQRAHPDELELYKKHGVHRGKEIAFEASQKQRYFERGIRKWKNRSTVALDELTKRSANLKVREWQKHLREHLDENQFLIRKRWREQISRAI
jgi:hypothetical protein